MVQRPVFPVSMTVGERKAKALRAWKNWGGSKAWIPLVIEGQTRRHLVGQSMESQPGRLCGYSNRLRAAGAMPVTGSVIDLRIEAGSISALCAGRPIPSLRSKHLHRGMEGNVRALRFEACAGKLDSAEALLGGRFPRT